MKIRLKREIVSLGRGIINVSYKTNKFIDPGNWDNFIKQKNIKLIDLRNTYEIDIGNFRNAINPNTKNFREFPNKFEKMNIEKNDMIAMYCTGGIRCEKAAGYLNHKGYKNVYQLKGGILNYFKHIENSAKWVGECFVFDDRVSVKQNLSKGKYSQCFGCRRPITNKDIKSKYFIKGVCCPYCYIERSNEQKRRSYQRQKQINILNRNKISHNFKNLKLSDLSKI